MARFSLFLIGLAIEPKKNFWEYLENVQHGDNRYTSEQTQRIFKGNKNKIKITIKTSISYCNKAYFPTFDDFLIYIHINFGMY